MAHEIIMSALGLVIAIARARARPRSLTISKGQSTYIPTDSYLCQPLPDYSHINFIFSNLQISDYSHITKTQKTLILPQTYRLLPLSHRHTDYSNSYSDKQTNHILIQTTPIFTQNTQTNRLLLLSYRLLSFSH